MKIDIVMPQMGESITEGTIIKWHKKKGDSVKKDEIIYEISTDKVDTEIPSPADGFIADIFVFETETVSVNTVVAQLVTDNEELARVEPVVSAPSTTQVGGTLVDIPMPKMGESITEGTIIKWHKKVGDLVKVDETIFEMSTDKVDTEVPSPVEGIIEEILCAEQETVPVDFIVARVRNASGLNKIEPVAAKLEEVKPSVQAAPITEKKPAVQAVDNRFYSPLVLNIARTEKIGMEELAAIPGNGLNGRLTKKDLLEYLQNRKAGSIAKPVTVKADLKQGAEVKSETTPAVSVQVIPMDNTRQKIMHHMLKSRDTSVHVTAILEVDMTRIHNFINANRDALLKNENIKLTYMPFISFAVIKALKEFPLMNASVDGNNIIQKNFINLGIAVAVEPNGLIVPNIKNADEKNIRGLAKAISEIGYKSRNKKLVPEDVMNGTFSITNYGVFGSLFGTPIINQPEVGILGVGAVTKKPVVVEVDGNDLIAVKPMMYLSLSHDHRLVDGMLGGRFLKFIKDMLENFSPDMF